MSRAVKIIIKIVLVLGIALFALYNYRIFSFSHGISQKYEQSNVIEALNTLQNVKKVEYYEKTIKSGDKIYKVYIETKGESYLMDATQGDLDGFNLLALFSENLKPVKISPIPFYVEIIVGFVILIIPTRWRKKKQTQEN